MKSGFTLIEVLVAFTILALGLVLIQDSFSGSTRNRLTAQNRAEAQALAPSILALFGTVYTEAGRYAGEGPNGRSWRLRATPLSRQDGPELALPLFEVEAEIDTVSWGGEPTLVSLRTIKSVTRP